MNRQILRLRIAIVSVVVVDAVRPTPQIMAMVLSLLLEKKGRMTDLKRLAQVDVVVVDATESGRRRCCRGGSGHRHVIPTTDGHLFFKRFRQILWDQLVGWRGWKVVIVGRAGRSGRGRTWRRAIVVVVLILAGFVVVVVLDVEERDNVVFLAKCPPPSESHQVAQLERRLAFALLQFLNESDDRFQRFVGPSVVRHNASLAAEIQNSFLILGIETEFVEDQHAFGLAENVVVQSAFWNVVVRRGLSEAHLLRHDGIDGLLERFLWPGWSFRPPLD